MQSIRYILFKLFNATMDVLPIIGVIVFFQIVIIKKPFPHIEKTILGIIMVIIGLFVFIEGLENTFFPIGENMANQFAIKGNIWWLIIFGFAIGFATTFAEPTVTIIANKTAQLSASAGKLTNEAPAISRYALELRLTIAFAVGLSIAFGVVKVIKGWPLAWFIMAGYGLIIAAAPIIPREFVGIAFDAGGIATSTISVPFITSLGIGLASSFRGRNPFVDGLGLIALACMTPILFVMLFSVLFHGPR